MVDNEAKSDLPWIGKADHYGTMNDDDKRMAVIVVFNQEAPKTFKKMLEIGFVTEGKWRVHYCE